jgi:hypothetical protein
METRISPSRGGEMFLPHYARYREARRGRRLNGALRRYVRQSAERATKSEPTLPVARCRALSANTNCAMLPKTSRRERERERERSPRRSFGLAESGEGGRERLSARGGGAVIFPETRNGGTRSDIASSCSRIPLALTLRRRRRQHSGRSGIARSFSVLILGEFIIIETVSPRVRPVYNRLIILKAVYLANYLHYNESRCVPREPNKGPVAV